MAGRINDDDIAEVRARTRIDEIVGEHVMLRPAGGGSFKGLCPFHDEKTPSFQVTPSRGLYYCFGCGEGGDVITFLQKVENLTFAEAVQRLADKAQVRLRISDDGGPRIEPGLRNRILEANSAAADFFAEQLGSPEALIARQFLAGRGFDQASAEHFGVGYAPKGGRLVQHLRGRGFTMPELVKAGLAREAGYDFFRGRLLWPIRDSGSLVLGFGGRRIWDDDRLPAKYINTPETPVYKKSQVLYGLDLARSAIGKRSQAVVVEGYTDVMACHIAGVDTAVASCGTAFGNDHGRLLQRLMGTHDAFNGEVIFTFDGDEAGQKAALKVFDGDQNFISQTYVAVEPTGLDPCDLRIQHGDAAVRELVGRRVPLYRFVMANVIQRYDLDRAEGRVDAVRAAAPLVSSVRDSSLVGQYIRELAGMVGMDPDDVRREVSRARNRPAEPRREVVRTREEAVHPAPQPQRLPMPDPADRQLSVERDVAKLVVQQPQLFSSDWHGLAVEDFIHPAYRELFHHAQQLREQGSVDAGNPWVERLFEASEAPVTDLVVQLGVEPLLRAPDAEYVSEYTARLRMISVTRQIADLKSKLQRTNPLADQQAYNGMFATLLGLENERRQLHRRAVGDV
ncbi:DNA primase [Parenemella sanctibonifatiensis]|uniref:DNA primase n=1 Tax=Parenemella sanctibonifatiensis TaxID=2016505 RepID=A0A255EB03_9ACTN|nr:DNA primase [Parenemella sanctibonifatiensis]OYN85323.1 DNA primase [Parenemella sanctibonifatiensis]